MTTRGIALAAGLAVPAAWLWWAEHLDAGWSPVLATAGLWWLAALRATWSVWLPAVVMVVALWLALPPQAPRRPVQAPGARPTGSARPAPPAPSATPTVRELPQEPLPDPARVPVPAPVPAPARTVWEAVNLSVPGAEGDDHAA